VAVFAALLTIGAIALVVWHRGSGAPPASDTSAARVTFSRDIAPIVFENCTVCHRPGGSGPFALLDYRDVKKRAGLIAAVTQRRYMPPWLPARGLVRFRGERGLSDEEIALIGEWVAQGAVEGDPADLPPRPEFAEGWQLGEPDLVVTLEEPYVLAAEGHGEGHDVFRNVVIPVPVSTPRWVKAVALRPGDPKVVHHVVMQVDRSRSSRLRDAEDAEPGFPGMEMAGSESPGGRTIGWTPGKVPIVDERLAWRLEPGTDVVLQLHLLPSGKPERIAPRVGFYFTEQPAAKRAFSILLRNDQIDIPAGDANHVIEDTLELPVPVSVYGIYPHAHYLGKEIEAFATLPDGTRRWLIHIPRWDFEWQDDYRYAEPVELPAGAVITMRYTYDNSAENPANPHVPPRRVRFGNRSSDEMATLAIQVVPPEPEDRDLLLEASMRSRLARNPRNWFAHSVLGAALKGQGSYDEAISHLREAIRLNPGHPGPLFNLANALREAGRLDAAVAAYRRVLAIDPRHPKAHNNLAIVFQQRGELRAALTHFGRQRELSPMDARVHLNLGNAYLALADDERAQTSFERALELDPRSVAAHEGLGDAARLAGRLGEAESHYRRALALDAQSPAASFGLGLVEIEHGDAEPGTAHLERAVAADATYLQLLNNEAWWRRALRARRSCWRSSRTR